MVGRALIGKRIATLLVGGLSIVLLTTFQNCGDSMKSSDAGFSSDSASEANSVCTTDCAVADPLSTSTGSGRLFSAGDAFSVNKLPYAPAGTLATKIADYSAITTVKALAMSANGYGFIAASKNTGITAIQSQTEADRIAIEGCQTVSNNQACAILAEGNFFKYDETAFKLAMTKILESGARAFNPATVPWQSDMVRSTRLPSYGNDTNAFKVLALHINGSGAYTTGTVSQAENMRIALERCEGYANGNPCTIYALGNAVQFNVNGINLNTTPALTYGPAVFDNTKVPFMSSAVRTNLSAYSTFIASNPNGALAIHPAGYYSYQTTAAASLSSCQALATTPCVIYAQGLQVVWTKASLDLKF